MEIEAEATAYIVTQQLGIIGGSAAYVSNHLKDGKLLPQGVSIYNIAKASGKIAKMAKRSMRHPKFKKNHDG